MRRVSMFHRRRKRKTKFSALWVFIMFGKLLVLLVSTMIAIILLDLSILYKAAKRIKDYFHYKSIGMNSLKFTKSILKMNPRQFEIFIAELFKSNGYKTKLTKESNDGGKDVVAYKDKDKIYIECKRWSIDNPCGRVLLQKLIGASVGDNANKAIFITTSKYNDNAIEYAKKVSWLELWDLNDILEMLYKTELKKIPWIFSKAMEFNDEEALDKCIKQRELIERKKEQYIN